MKALVVAAEDGPDGVALREVPRPEGPLVIAVRAAGVGFPDLLMSHGRFQIRQPLPFTLGWEAAGTVVEAPPASAFGVGQNVVTLTFGAHAEQLAAIAEVTFPMPEGLSFEQAAAFPLNYLTAYAALAVRGRLRAGETVLVQGAGGGAGSAAIQVAKGLGGRVLAVASTARKAATALAAGADEAFLAGDDWRSQVLEASASGVDVAYDPVGGERFGQTLRCMASQGRLVVVGFAAGEIPEIAVNRLLLRNVDVCGCTWSVLAERPRGLADAARALGEMVAAGHVAPLVERALALEDGVEALRALERRDVHGKLVLTLPA